MCRRTRSAGRAAGRGSCAQGYRLAVERIAGAAATRVARSAWRRRCPGRATFAAARSASDRASGATTRSLFSSQKWLDADGAAVLDPDVQGRRVAAVLAGLEDRARSGNAARQDRDRVVDGAVVDDDDQGVGAASRGGCGRSAPSAPGRSWLTTIARIGRRTARVRRGRQRAGLAGGAVASRLACISHEPSASWPCPAPGIASGHRTVGGREAGRACR